MFINPRTKSMISILSLYKYDPHLFDMLTLPEGIDKNIAVNKILQETANLESFYTDPEYLSFSIKLWGDVNFWTFKKLYESTMFDYNPIWNKDGTITETREKASNEAYNGQTSRTAEDDTENENKRENVLKTASTASTDKTGQEIRDTAKTQNSNTTESGATSEETATNRTAGTDTTENTTTETSVAGFNSADYVKSGKTDADRTNGTEQNETGNETKSGTETKTGTGSVSETERAGGATSERTDGTETTDGTESTTERGKTGRRTAETGTDEQTRTAGENERYERTERGNIGITSTQQLIKEEREVSLFRLYEYIADDFKKNFCILVY